MCCWKSGGREREKILASLSSLPSSGGTLAALPRGWPGSRRPSGASTFLELSAGGQSRRNWVSSASSESSFRKRFIWEPREEMTPVVAMPDRDGSTQLSPTSPEPLQTDTRSLKVAGMGGETGHGHPRGPATTLGTATGTAMGVAVGTAVIPCTSGAYDLRCGAGRQLLALGGRGWAQFPLGTPPLLGLFWGSQDPPVPHGLPGGQGGGREEAKTPRRDEERLGSDPSGAAARGRQTVGGGPLVPVIAARSRGVSAGGGTRDSCPRRPRRQQARGPGRQTRPGPRRLLPPCLPVPEGARAAALGRARGDRDSRPQLPPRGVAGLGQGTGTAGSGWLRILFTSAGGRRRVPKGTSGSGSRGTEPCCQRASLSPGAQGTGGEPRPHGQ